MILSTVSYILRLFDTTRLYMKPISTALKVLPPYLFGMNLVGIFLYNRNR